MEKLQVLKMTNTGHFNTLPVADDFQTLAMGIEISLYSYVN